MRKVATVLVLSVALIGCSPDLNSTINTGKIEATCQWRVNLSNYDGVLLVLDSFIRDQKSHPLGTMYSRENLLLSFEGMRDSVQLLKNKELERNPK